MFKNSSLRMLAPALATFTLAGCASVWNPTTPEDPYEGYNRAMFTFNRGVDKYVIRPIAVGYDFITPDFVQRGIKNFFYNINLVPTILNDALQANGPWLASDVGRLLVNTTLGLGGLLDPATPIGLEKHDQDFGITMAKWGVKESPYFMIPILGPSTARDVMVYPTDFYLFDVFTYIRPEWITYAADGLQFIQYRAKFLKTDKSVDEAFDPYVFVRDFYLQTRKAKIQKAMHPDQDFQGGDDLLPTTATAEPAATGETTTTAAPAAAPDPSGAGAVAKAQTPEKK